MVVMVHTLVSFPSISRSILLMPTLGVDLCTCSTAMMDGDLISLIRFLLMKLVTSSMLPMNTLLANAVATQIMARAHAVRGIRIVSTVQVPREAALWMEMNLPCVATQRNIWDGVTEINFSETI